MITIGELLHGSDADFVVNAYLAVLGRWPDEAGYDHHLAGILGRPERRPAALQGILGSEEARLKARPFSMDATPVPPERALAAQLRLRTDALRADLAALRDTPVPPSPGLASEVLALGTELAALRLEMRERLAGLEALIAGKLPPAPSLSPALSLDYVNDLVEGAQTQLAHRLRALEKRLAG
ncbi:DUF4214 domain-containing protein [Roseococcus sp.]|uniref:DUF4214 domain-containing protein n=1 Tax=Roseococcus sp. TaxID=2109646 RepID=UPI003BAC9B7C